MVSLRKTYDMLSSDAGLRHIYCSIEWSSWKQMAETNIIS
jgi:hypothetical protein